MQIEPERPASPDYRFSFWFLLLVVVASGLVAELAFKGLRAAGLAERLPALLVVALPPFLSGAVLPYVLIRWLYRSSLRDFGVRWREPGRRILPWLVGSSVLAVVAWVGFWGLIYFGLSFAARQSPEQVPLTVAELHARNPLHMLLHGNTSARVVAHVLHMTLLVGFAEELFGRGLLQNALDRRYLGVLGRGWFTVRTSTLLAALLFAFWHTQWLSLDPLTILKGALTSMTIILVPSLVLCVAYEKTRSMLAVIVLHDVIDAGKLAAWYLWSLILGG